MTPHRRRGLGPVPPPRVVKLPGRAIAMPAKRAGRFSRRHWPILLAILGVALVLGGYLATTLLSQRRSQDVAVLGSVVEDQNTKLASAGLPTVDPTRVVSGTADLPSTTTTTTTATVTLAPNGVPTTVPGPFVPGPTVTAEVTVPGPAGSSYTTTVTAAPGQPVTITAPGQPPVTVTLPASTSTATTTVTTTATTTETTTAPAPPPVTVTETAPAPPPVTVTETAPGPTVTETTTEPGPTVTVTETAPAPDPPAPQPDPEVTP